MNADLETELQRGLLGRLHATNSEISHLEESGALQVREDIEWRGLGLLQSWEGSESVDSVFDIGLYMP